MKAKFQHFISPVWKFRYQVIADVNDTFLRLLRMIIFFVLVTFLALAGYYLSLKSDEIIIRIAITLSNMKPALPFAEVYPIFCFAVILVIEIVTVGLIELLKEPSSQDIYQIVSMNYNDIDGRVSSIDDLLQNEVLPRLGNIGELPVDPSVTEK